MIPLRRVTPFALLPLALASAVSLADAAPASPAASKSTPLKVKERIVFLRSCDIWSVTPSGTSAKRVLKHAKGRCLMAPALSHDGRYLVYQDLSYAKFYKSRLVRLDLKTGKAKALTGYAHHSRSDLSPKKNVIAYGVNGNIYTMGLSGKHLSTISRDKKSFDATYASDGKTVYFRTWRDGYECTVQDPPMSIRIPIGLLYKGGTGAAKKVTRSRQLDIVQGDAHGKHVAYIGQVITYAPPLNYCYGKPNWQQDWSKQYLYIDGKKLRKASSGPVWSPTGSRLAYGSYTGKIVTVDRNGKHAKTVTNGYDPSWGRMLS